MDEHTIPDHDILCAGFPCQAFSISGKQRGFEDSRGTLFFDVARIIRQKHPKIVFMENVKNFASHDNGHTLEVVKGTLEELGYTFFKDVLNAVDYGIPQNRERIYMVCFQNDLKIKDFSFPKAFPLKKHVEDFLLEDESLVENLYISRPDTYFNGRYQLQQQTDKARHRQQRWSGRTYLQYKRHCHHPICLWRRYFCQDRRIPDPWQNTQTPSPGMCQNHGISGFLQALPKFQPGIQTIRKFCCDRCATADRH